MQELIHERILKSEEQLLSGTDRAHLILKRNKQLIYLLVAYVPLALILAFVFFSGPSVVYREQYPFPEHEITEDDINQFYLVAPFVCGFLLLLLTFFFILYYLQTAAPLIKDIRKNKKLLLHIRPEKTEMAFFNKYYISTPIGNKQQVRIGKDDFFNITDNNFLILELAPHSQSILRLVNNGKEISYY